MIVYVRCVWLCVCVPDPTAGHRAPATASSMGDSGSDESEADDPKSLPSVLLGLADDKVMDRDGMKRLAHMYTTQHG